ncbi:MAG: tripartite tricarboxylate transporter permease [Acidimicrobiales bacterium]
MLHDLWGGLAAYSAPEVIGLLVVGVVVGVFMGVLPGLGVALVLSIMLAFVYHLGVTPAIVLMLGTQAASYFSASITAILLNSPGAPESMATTFDGYKMAERGEAGKALGISAASTAIGGLVGCAVLLGLIQIVGYLPNIFHPPEYVALIILAVILTGTLGTDSATKAVLSAALGLMVSFIGNDAVTGAYRFTFGIPALYGGISIVALALGSFAVPQMVFMYGSNKAISIDDPGGAIPDFRRQVRDGVVEALRHWFLLVRSALVGVLCGVIPGIGGFTANFLSYGIAQQTTRNGSKFGTGVAEGIVAPEGSSLAKEAGSLVPALGLGLPSGLGMVLFLAALAILGLQPGPGFTTHHPILPYTMLWAVALAGVLGTLLGLVAAPVLAKVTRVRGPLLFPFIVGLSVVGSFASDVSMTTVIEVLCFGCIGVVLRRLRYSLAALAVGLVLGSTLEDNIFLTRQIFGMRFLERPLTIIIFLVCIGALVVQVVRARRHGGIAAAAAEEAAIGDHRLLDFIVALAFTFGSLAYVLIASGYGSQSRLLPLIVGIVAIVFGALRLIFTTRALLHRRAEPLEVDGAGETSVEAGPPSTGTMVRGPAPLGPSPAPSGTDATQHGAVEVLNTGARLPEVGSEVSEVEASPGATGAPGWRRYAREVVGLCWLLLMIVGCRLVGFRVAVPVVVFLYGAFGVRYSNLRARFAFSVLSALVMFVVTYGIFDVLHLSYASVLSV